MRCTCCGRWTVEAIVMQDTPSSPRYIWLRIKSGVYYVGDYRYPYEVIEVLRTAGVLEKMVDER